MLIKTALTDMPRDPRLAARRAVPASGLLSASLAAMAAAIALLPVSDAAAQSSPNSFQLPEPSPTPTPAPQGPVDVREGVPIGPRPIPTEQPTSRPTARPTARPTEEPTPRPAARPTATPSPAPAARTPAPGAPPSPAATGTPQTAPSAASDPGAGASSAADQTSSDPVTGDPDTAAPLAGPAAETSGADGGAPAASSADNDASADRGADGQTTGYWPWIAALFAMLSAGIAVWFWRRRSANRVTRLAAPTKPRPAPSADTLTEVGEAPPRVDLSLEIVVATRSVMKFSLEYRVTLANRSDRAVRDLNISAQLASARRGAPNAPPVAGGQPLETIARIGPHQSRAVTGQMQMPLAEIGAFLQGRKPLFIPLLHITIEGAGQPALTRTFVVGTPSAAGEGRLHPIPLDTPPGSVPGLKAREITVKAA